MTRILFVGDLHTKTFLLPLIDKAARKHKPDRIICLGDYMDDWNISSTENYESAQKIFKWAHRCGNVALLFGNHDMGYYSGACDCSGNDYAILPQVQKLFTENFDLLKVAESSDNWLFTHAGLTKNWARKYIGMPTTAGQAAKLLNNLLDSPKGMQELQAVGRYRGGFDWPSPLWADWAELNGDPCPDINQITGHTPQRTCQQNTSCNGERLWCCDTFSTYGNGDHLGDGSMLLLDTEATGEAGGLTGRGIVQKVEQPDGIAFRAGYRKP